MKGEVGGRRVCAVLVAALALGLGACATKQVSPVGGAIEVKRICVIENPRVRLDFLVSYKKALEERGLHVEVFPETAHLSICPVTTQYTANWRWDMVLFLAYADLQIYNDGRTAGRAVFDARGSRFISAEGKIKEMVDDLFKR